MDGGTRIAEYLTLQEVSHVFTLCGGHISPILVACRQRGISVIDVRQEATAVFAADALARLSGKPGVAVVTAGPGATNSVTATKNAQMAQSPVVILAGAAATVLRGRGALQDMDLGVLYKPVVKRVFAPRRVCDLVPMLQQAFYVSQSDVPGPVLVEIPLDLLYAEDLVREQYGLNKPSNSFSGKLRHILLNRHANRIFKIDTKPRHGGQAKVVIREAKQNEVIRAAKLLSKAKRPLLLIGGQALLNVDKQADLIGSIKKLGVPVFLVGMARGLLGASNSLQLRHQRRNALKLADLVILAGVPCDFRLGYGAQIQSRARLIAINRSRHDLSLNKRPHLAIHGDPAGALVSLARNTFPHPDWGEWLDTLKQHDRDRDSEILTQAEQFTTGINPLTFLIQLDKLLGSKSILIADGGDFVATASYVLHPPRARAWLDPGVFGTLGVGAGFGLSAKLLNPDAEVWILFGDGAVGYSLAEFDTFVRHRVPLVAIVGNNAGWAQVAREQLEIYSDDIATTLKQSEYHKVVEGFGAIGLLLEDATRISATLAKARQLALSGKVVLVNVKLADSDFRRGSISM